MKNYICKKAFSIEKCDDDGFLLENECQVIEKGERFQSSDNKFRLVGGPDSVRLNADDGTWLEIDPETLNEYFEEVREGGVE